MEFPVSGFLWYIWVQISSMGSPDSDFLWDLWFQNFYEVFGLRFPTYEIPNKEERGRQQSEPFYGKASLLYWEAAVQTHSVDDTAARQQHGKAERCQGQKPSRRASLAARCTVYIGISFVRVCLTGFTYPLRRGAALIAGESTRG